MLYYLTAAGLIAHTYFWGLGLAWLALPRIWRRWWWVFAPAFGLGLQSAVVWFAAHTPLAGTNAYADWSELIPLLLLAAGLRRRPGRTSGTWGAVLAVATVMGWMLLSPLSRQGQGLTTSSLGSCDQADYEGGARAFKEFSRDDRTGFMGLAEVSRVGSADYFFDFWLRLNHFTPSALLAHNATVFGVESYRLVSVTAAALGLLSLPLVFFLARVTVGLRGRWLIGFLLLNAISPIKAYAVHHGALGQLYATQGIALLTLVIFGASRAACARRPVWPFFPLALVAFWLLAGSYNFILLVCLAPGGAWLLAQFWLRRDGAATGRVVGLLAAALAICALLFWGRFNGLVERFNLFEKFDFGWVVPLASPEGWLGILRDTGLHAWPRAVRVALGLAVTGLWLAGMGWLWRRAKGQALAALALVLPVLFGWCLLAWETQVRANASYDAYKLIAVFYPGLQAGLCCWLAAAWHGGRRVQWFVSSLLVLILAANLFVAGEFRRQMADPPLRVSNSFAGLARLEDLPRVQSLNMRIEDFWTRLWANAFLLRKPQYFATHTYEGRRPTELKGEWDLSDSLLRSVPFRRNNFILINEQFHAERVGAAGRVEAGFGAGWHQLEGRGLNRWRWASGPGSLLLANASPEPMRVRLLLNVRGIQPARLQATLNGESLGDRALDVRRQRVVFADVLLPVGSSTLTLQTDQAPVSGGESDPRLLSVALYHLTIQPVRKD